MAWVSEQISTYLPVHRVEAYIPNEWDSIQRETWRLEVALHRSRAWEVYVRRGQGAKEHAYPQPRQHFRSCGRSVETVLSLTKVRRWILGNFPTCVRDQVLFAVR